MKPVILFSLTSHHISEKRKQNMWINNYSCGILNRDLWFSRDKFNLILFLFFESGGATLQTSAIPARRIGMPYGQWDMLKAVST